MNRRITLTVTGPCRGGHVSVILHAMSFKPGAMSFKGGECVRVGAHSVVVALATVLLSTACGSEEGEQGGSSASGGLGGEAGSTQNDTGGASTGGVSNDTGGASTGGNEPGGAGGGGSCDDGDKQPGDEPCGLNNRGTVEQVCDEGAWVASSTCVDPDECTDDDVRTLTDVCGMNDRGDVSQSCVEGAWEDSSTCADPDECTDGDVQLVECRGGDGQLERGCEGGAWKDGLCTLESIQRASVTSAEVQGDADSEHCSVSANGRFVAFQSFSTNLTPGDTNGHWDIFVRDLDSRTTERVSVDSSEVPGNSESLRPSISGDGRFVAFSSYSVNLVPGDTNGGHDIFVRNLENGTTLRVSVANDGAQANHASLAPSISADGRFVAFESSATNLVTAEANNHVDIFVRDLQSGTTQRVSVASNGGEANAEAVEARISGNGRFVAFESRATNLVADDTNGYVDIFVRDLQSGTTQRVNVDSYEAQAIGYSYYPAISGDGRFVAFMSDAPSLVPGDTNGTHDIFVRDLQNGTTERVSLGSNGAQGDGSSYYPSISDDGRFVAFMSDAPNLVPGDTNGTGDIFVRDVASGTTRRVSQASSGTVGNGRSDHPRISADGSTVVFYSRASNLVAGDTNGAPDVFVTAAQ